MGVKSDCFSVLRSMAHSKSDGISDGWPRTCFRQFMNWGGTEWHTGESGGELEENTGKADKRSSKTFFAPVRTAQPHAEVVKTPRISDFQHVRASVVGLKAVYCLWKLGRSKLEQKSHWGWQNCSLSKAHGCGNSLCVCVCVYVTLKGRRWYTLIYIPVRVFQISVPFHFLSVHDAGARLWQELLTKAAHVRLMNERTVFIQLYQAGKDCDSVCVCGGGR